MRGVKFLIDKSRKKTGVVLDLRKNAALWEDVYGEAKGGRLDSGATGL
jgi:hypothetical protein